MEHVQSWPQAFTTVCGMVAFVCVVWIIWRSH
jgi:hypothetical protein